MIYLAAEFRRVAEHCLFYPTLALVHLALLFCFLIRQFMYRYLFTYFRRYPRFPNQYYIEIQTEFKINRLIFVFLSNIIRTYIAAF